MRFVPPESPPNVVQTEQMPSPPPPVTKSVKPDSQHALLQQPSVKIREEGELSSSSDAEELSACSKERLSGLGKPDGAALDKGAVVITGRENTAVKPLSPISSANVIGTQAQSYLQSDSRISVENIPLPLRSSTTKQNGKSGQNDNLVIVFSDGESGSDSECKEKKTKEAKGVVSRVENTKPAPLTYQNYGLFQSQKAKENNAKLQPNRGIFTRIFFPQNTKPYGSKVKDAAKAQVKPRSVRKNHNALDLRAVNQFCKPTEGTCLETGELQDLRQKIAMRETEIKLKTSRKVRETMAGSSLRYDSSTTKTNIQKRERGRAMPSEFVHSEDMEPDKKRMKNGHDSNPSGGQYDVSCQKKNQTLLNQHIESVRGVLDSDCLDSLENEVGQSYNSNSSGLGNHSLQSLFAIEEMHDKELEEAQKYRRHCEIEERIARRTYCEAQSALIEATGRCNSLYLHREQASTQILSLLVEDVHSRVATRKDQVDNTTSVNISKEKSLQVLFELDGSLEKELEEAQEFRHKCEVDERNSLKAYRKTQFALIEASDRCSYLYRKRQQLATRANIKYYSRCYSQFESSTCNSLSAQSRVHLDAFQSSQYVKKGHTDAQIRFSSDFHSTSKDTAKVGNSKDSETCSEPDSSSSEPLLHPDSNADYMLCSLNSNSARSADQEEQTLLLSNGPCPSESRCIKQSRRIETKNALDDDSDRAFLLQEARLRSELCARLGRRSFSQKESSDIKRNQHSMEKAAENGINCEKSEPYASNFPLSADEKVQPSNCGVDPDQDRDSHLSYRSATCSADPVLRSTFFYIKNPNSAFRPSVSIHAKNIEWHSNNSNSFKGSDNSSEKTLLNDMEDNLVLSARDVFSKQYESYSCNTEADLFWPLCMYELRGKCNDEQCRWQHIKPRQNQETNKLGSLSTACNIRQEFHISRAASRLLQRKMLNAEQSGHLGFQRFQATESTRKLSYLQSRGTLARPENNIPDAESSLEAALIILDQEIDKNEGTNEALLFLSRAIEVDPNSSALWIIYLLVFYSSKRSDENDDMFLYAVKNNPRSYELWLLYINSRLECSSRLVAYDSALTALCSEYSVPKSDIDSLILDIYLQMLDFLCVSGQVETAVAKLIELTLPASTSDESPSLLSRIYSLLSVPDKCILWVCCLYLGVYRKLPEAIVNRFEQKKEFVEIVWPAVELIYNEMQSTKKLMIAVEQLFDTCIDIDLVSLDSFTDSNLKSLHFFAVNHVRCKVILEGFSSGRLLAEKYIKLYPTCRELVLLVARMYSNDFLELSVAGFEEALCIWPKEFLGIHCIWNQYASYALEKQKFDVASAVLSRWYESAFKRQPVRSQLSKEESFVPQLQNTLSDSLSREDDMFECLNLALYHVLRSEHQEAQLAVDKALEIAPSDLFKHCVREHASFRLIDVQPADGISISGIVEFLKGYMLDPRASLTPCVLSRKFISNIKKPRIQQLFKKSLAEISPDCAILNLALEVWFGPSLLPQNFMETKQLVNFVEAVMEIVPTNHQFASRVFRLVGKDFNGKDVGTCSLLFWASNLLVNSIFESVPLAPEFVWVEAAALLSSSTSIQDVSEKFHERAVSVHPFSKRLWMSLSRIKLNSETVIKCARERGIQLELPQSDQ